MVGHLHSHRRPSPDNPARAGLFFGGCDESFISIGRRARKSLEDLAASWEQLCAEIDMIEKKKRHGP